MSEPSIETALGWWTELPDKWTPVGWKDHLFRFNVFFNGAIYAHPYVKRRFEQWEDQGVQITLAGAGRQRDDGSVVQGWNDCPAPVLWSEWQAQGFLVRQEVFAHIPGARDVITGIEPLYAWMRLSVRELCPALPAEDVCRFALTINAPHISAGMDVRNNIRYYPERSRYPRELHADRVEYDSAGGLRVLEPDGKVRLAIAPGQNCAASFKDGTPTDNDCQLLMELPGKPGANVDLLLPMLPDEPGMFDIELTLGFDGALSQANQYWSEVPSTAAVFDCPEDYINEAIKHNLKMAEVIAERNPETGICSLLTGSLQYQQLWATPAAMIFAMFLDPLGCHSTVEKYLDMLKREQGTVTPPGDAFKPHPGYLSTPKSLTSINWLTDHGALLWTISEHCLLHGDPQCAEGWLPVILKACEFVRDARAIKGHGGVEGLMPPAVASDKKVQIQGVWTDGWNYKGLATAVRLLKRMNHPRAAEFESEAQAYKKTFVKAFTQKTRTMPEWTDADGIRHHLTPIAMSGERRQDMRHAFYLDTGPLFPVFAGLMNASNKFMRSTLKWFREGPQNRFYRHDGNCWQIPRLAHEISSCEPCYSWNVFHSHQLGDRHKFLEGMYSLFTGALSRQTYTLCETRGGITGLTPALLPAYLARLAVIDDQIEEGSLHLLRLMPLAWLRIGREARFENMPTEFGPVTLVVSLRTDAELDVRFTHQFHAPPDRIVLRIPPVKGLKTVKLNGERLDWKGKARGMVVG